MKIHKEMAANLIKKANDGEAVVCLESLCFKDPLIQEKWGVDSKNVYGLESEKHKAASTPWLAFHDLAKFENKTGGAKNARSSFDNAVSGLVRNTEFSRLWTETKSTQFLSEQERKTMADIEKCLEPNDTSKDFLDCVWANAMKKIGSRADSIEVAKNIMKALSLQSISWIQEELPTEDLSVLYAHLDDPFNEAHYNASLDLVQGSYRNIGIAETIARAQEKAKELGVPLIIPVGGAHIPGLKQLVVYDKAFATRRDARVYVNTLLESDVIPDETDLGSRVASSHKKNNQQQQGTKTIMINSSSITPPSSN